MKNNILWVENGSAINAPLGGSIVESDHNLFYTPVNGTVANVCRSERLPIRLLGTSRQALTRIAKLPIHSLPTSMASTIDLALIEATGLTASYFNNIDLSGSPVFQRIESQVDFGAFGIGGSPAPGVNADNFSARWEGFVRIPTAGDYTFFVRNDNGVRFYLDNTLRIDQWTTNSNEYSYVATGLAAGWYPIKMETRELTGNAFATLSFQGPGIAKQVMNRDYLGTTPGFTTSSIAVLTIASSFLQLRRPSTMVR